MNVTIITSHSAWKVKWLPNRTEADQGLKREVAYTLESEKLVWTYYYQMHPLVGADSESNMSSKRKSSEKLNKESKEKGRRNRDKP
jgi:hypothetical protein